MNMVMELFLGILTAMGGFVEVGELTFTLNAGSRYGYSLLWIAVLGTIGIMVFCEMAGRVAAVAKQPVFNLIRERAGFEAGLVTLIAATITLLLTCAAEIGGIALVLELLGASPYRLLIVATLIALVVIVWFFRFSWLERTFGLLGLMMIVFLVVAWRQPPDWAEMAKGLLPGAPRLGSSSEYASYAYYGVALLSSIMLPYETYFYSAGALEDGWKPADIPLNRIVVLFGFALGSLLGIALMVIGAEWLAPRGIQVVAPGTAALATAWEFGRTGMLIALLGMLFAFAGAAIETALSGAYNIAHFLGWPWGKAKPNRAGARFSLAWIAIFVGAALIVLTGVDPIMVVEYSIVFSVVLLPFTYFALVVVAGDRDVMGDHANGPFARTLGWVFLGLVTLAALAAIPLMIVSKAGLA